MSRTERVPIPALLALAAALALYLAAILWFSRLHVLDDALIHLRYAELLLEYGFFTADGLAPSFGTSSPLFVVLAAALHAVAPSDFTTKLLSVFFYLCFVAGIGGLMLRTRGAARLGWGALVILCTAPMGVRWLTDGMETSLVACQATLLGLAAARDERTMRRTPLGVSGLVLLCAACVATRVEMVALIGLAALAVANAARGSLRARIGRAAPLALGAVAGLLAVWWVFGTVVPDAVIAKASGETAPVRSVASIARSFGGGLGFGIGLLALWVASVAVCLRGQPRPRRIALVLPNLALLLLWGLAASRGQYIQGIRPLLSIMMFMIATNLAMIAADRRPRAFVAAPRWLARLAARPRAGAVLGAASAAFVFTVEFERFHDIVAHRSEAFVEMRELNLAELEETSGIGWDVGHVMYFTKAHVCDVSGLINGRAAAASPEPARLDACLRQDVDFVFTTTDKARQLMARSGDRFRDWPVCGLYVFQNVGPTAPHVLAVSPAHAPRVCPKQIDSSPLRLATLRAS